MAGSVNINSITDPLFISTEGAIIAQSAAYVAATAVAEADYIADIAVGVSTVASIYASAAFLDIGQDYYDLYKEQRDFYYSSYQLGAESPFAAEVFGEPVYVENMAGAYADMSNDFLAFFEPYEGWYERKMVMYHMPSFVNLSTHSSQAIDRVAHQDDWGNYIASRERHLQDVYSNRRFSRQLDSLNVGIKQGTAVERGLASSFAVLDEAYGTAGGFFATQANGLGRMSGYFDARRSIDLAEFSSRTFGELPASRSGYINADGSPAVNIPIGMDERLS